VAGESALDVNTDTRGLTTWPRACEWLRCLHLGRFCPLLYWIIIRSFHVNGLEFYIYIYSAFIQSVLQYFLTFTRPFVHQRCQPPAFQEKLRFSVSKLGRAGDQTSNLRVARKPLHHLLSHCHHCHTQFIFSHMLQEWVSDCPLILFCF